MVEHGLSFPVNVCRVKAHRPGPERGARWVRRTPCVHLNTACEVPRLSRIRHQEFVAKSELLTLSAINSFATNRLLDI